MPRLESLRRLPSLVARGVLQSAIDAAHSAQASNSLEKMLCHQLAAAHFSAMRLMEPAMRLIDQSANLDLRLRPDIARLPSANVKG